jgi:hypothetical protein
MSREGAQVKAAEAGRRGSVGHVEVFRMDGVGTSIVGETSTSTCGPTRPADLHPHLGRAGKVRKQTTPCVPRHRQRQFLCTCSTGIENMG